MAYGPGDKPAKVVKRKPRVVKAGPPVFPTKIPVRPGAVTNRYASKPSTQAQRTHVHVARVKRNRALVKARAQHDVPTDADLAAAKAYSAKRPVVPTGNVRVGTSVVPAAMMSTDPAVLAAAGFKAEGVAEKIARLPIAAAAHVPADLADLAVTTPSSLAKLGSTAVHDPARVPGMLAAPYKQLAADPLDFATEHPVSTALMVSPAARLPGRALGKVARVTGRQTLERPAAVLPGTALREARTGSRDYFVRKVQARRDKGSEAPTMTGAQVQKRTDEFFDVARKHQVRMRAQAVEQARGLPEAERAAVVKKAGKRVKHQVRKRFVQEFGATAYRTPQGTVFPKQAAQGALHATREDAQAIADKVPFDATVVKAGKQYGVVPRVAADRLRAQRAVGTSAAVGSRVFRTAGKSFRSAVLPLSAKWLTGQATEAGLRSAVAGAGPLSLIREAKVFRKLEAQDPGAGVEFRQRTSGGGQFGLTGTAREFADGGRTLAQEFEGTSLAKPAAGVTRAAAAPGVRHVRAGFRAYSHVVFNVVNRAIEQTAMRAMTGKALKTGPLMEHRILGLTDAALEEAAQGLRATENQVALGRAVDRMYGAYSKFSNDKRETLLHTTPFYPWYRNVVTFLTKVLPVDHPVTTALLADLDAATEEWRKAHGLSFHGGGRRPGFLLGGYPVGQGDQVVRYGRYTPFSPGDPLSAVADLALPQFAGTVENLKGVDFTGKPVKGSRLLNAALTTAEAHVPGVAPAGRITGLSGRYVRKKDQPVTLSGKPLLRAVRREVDPFIATRPPSSSSSAGPGVRVPPVDILLPRVRVKQVKVKPFDILR